MKYSLLALAFLVVGMFVPTSSVHAATGDVTAVRIEPDGWEAEIDIQGFQTGGAYNFGLSSTSVQTNPNIVLQTTSQGYDTNGNPTTIHRTVVGTQWIRLPYPANTGSGPGTVKDETVNGNTLTIKVALSDFVYAGDTNITATIASSTYVDSGTGGTRLGNNAVSIPVTNSSTLSYPKVIGRWAWPGYERETGDFPVEASIFDRFPQNGNPVADVIFTATDQHGHSVSVSSNTVTRSVHTGDANVVQTYNATIPVAGLTQGDVIAVNFVAYPWVGDASSVLNSSIGADGVAQPDERLGPLYELNDAQGTYGIGYALVSPNGATTTAKVYSTEAAAEAGGDATAFSTIGKAVEAIKLFQQATYGRANAGGGVVLLASGSYTYPGYATTTDLGHSDTWLVIRPAAGVSRSSAVVSGAATSRVLPTDRIEFQGLTLNGSTTLAMGRSATDAIWLNNDAINLPVKPNIYSWHVVYMTQNAITAFAQNFTNFSTYRSPFALARGNNSAVVLIGDLYAILGNNNVEPRFVEANSAAGNTQSENSIYAFNTLYDTTTEVSQYALKTPILAGAAFVENVIEKVTTIEPLLGLAGDNSYAVANNVLMWRNTFAGERENLGYDEYGTVSYDRLNWRMGYNIFQQWNNKDDRFSDSSSSPPNANRIGGWSVGYNVGSSGNLFRAFTFRPEFQGLSSLVGANPAYINDASYAGTRLGNGNYQITGTSSAIDIAGAPTTFEELLPYDLLGNPITGKGIDAGAYEYASVPPPDTTPPSVTVLAPIGTLPSGTSATTLAVNTNENATCAYATTAGTAFASMQSFAVTGSTTHSTTLTGLTDGQAYQYYVKCQDTAGNVSGDTSVTFSVASAADTVPPTVSITQPINGSTVSGTVSITASASDNVGVTSLQFLLDGSVVATATTSPYSYTWDTTTASNGTHTIAAIASDAAGNTATTSVSVTVNNQAQQTGADTTTGLISHLTFDQSSISGTTAQDVSGHGNNGSIIGSPASTTGEFGDALSFNGTNYVDLGSSNFGLSSNYTISFWVNQTANGATTYPAMAGRGAYSYPFAYQLYGTGTTNHLRIVTRTSAGTAYLYPTTAINKSQWYLFTVVQNGASRTVYLNGTAIASDTLNGTISWPAGSDFVIGKVTPSATNDGIVGSLDDFRLYNRALSAADVAALYQGQ